MTLNPIKANMTELEIGNQRFLFSYKTLVAYSILTNLGREWYRTSKFWSRTTTRHINAWLPKDQASEIDQDVLDKMTLSFSAEVK